MPGVRIVVPPGAAPSPARLSCTYLRRDKPVNPPPLCDGEGLASRILEMRPAGAQFPAPVVVEAPHFASLRGRERELVILRSDDGEHWREHQQAEATEDDVQEAPDDSLDADGLDGQYEGRVARISTGDFPRYFAVVTRIRQEVHAVGPDGGTIVSTVVPQVRAFFPEGALTTTVKVALQAQPVPDEIVQRMHGNLVAVSPVVTVEPRRRKFHKAIALGMPLPRPAAQQSHVSTDPANPPTLRLMCSIAGGAAPAQWADITDTSRLKFSAHALGTFLGTIVARSGHGVRPDAMYAMLNAGDTASFSTTVSARFWLVDCQPPGDAVRAAHDLYAEAASVPYVAKFVVCARRHSSAEGQLRVFCVTGDKTLEKQRTQGFVEIARSSDVQVTAGKNIHLEFAGNLAPGKKTGEQPHVHFVPFQDNRTAFTISVRGGGDPSGRIAFMAERRPGADTPGVQPQQRSVCTLAVTLPE